MIPHACISGDPTQTYVDRTDPGFVDIQRIDVINE